MSSQQNSLDRSGLSTLSRWLPRAAALLLALLTAGCSTESLINTDSVLKIRMFGSLSPPEGVAGTASPISQTYSFLGVALTKSDGSGDEELYEDEPVDVRIVARPQQVFKYTELGTFVTDKVTFSAIKVRFEPLIVVHTKANGDTEFQLESGELSLAEAFAPEKSTEYTLNIKVSWGKTLATADDGSEVITAPTFELAYSDISD